MLLRLDVSHCPGPRDWRGLTDNRRLRLQSLIALSLAGLCASCTVTMISSYDETTDRDVTALHKTVADLLGQLDQAPVPDYASLKKVYDGIRNDLGATRFRNELRPNNTITVKQLDILRSLLSDLERQHKAGTFNQAMVNPTRELLDQTFRAVLKLEFEKKSLDKPR